MICRQYDYICTKEKGIKATILMKCFYAEIVCLKHKHVSLYFIKDVKQHF